MIYIYIQLEWHGLEYCDLTYLCIVDVNFSLGKPGLVPKTMQYPDEIVCYPDLIVAKHISDVQVIRQTKPGRLRN